MADIQKYLLVGRDGCEIGTYFDSYREAETEAKRSDCAVVEHTYTYEDTDLVFTPDGSDEWPMPGGTL